MVRLRTAQGRSMQLLKRRFRPNSHFARIWAQLGCNKSSRGFLRAPKVAIGAVKLRSVTSGFCSVTAEVASSSLVVPAILFKQLREWHPLRLPICDIFCAITPLQSY